MANGKIVDAKFKTFGCGSAIASSSVASEWVKGKSLEEAMTIKNTDISNHLKLPPVKLHCSLLAEDAIKAAVNDYVKKSEKKAREIESRLSEVTKEADEEEEELETIQRVIGRHQKEMKDIEVITQEIDKKIREVGVSGARDA